MKRTYRETTNKGKPGVASLKPPLMNACTVTELKMDKNDFRMSRPERKHEPITRHTEMRGRSHGPTNKSNTCSSSQQGKTSFSSKSYNSLGVGDVTRISTQNKVCSSNQQPQKKDHVPNIRPALMANAVPTRTNRIARSGPMKAPFVLGGRGKGIPPLESTTKQIDRNQASNNTSNNKFLGKSDRFNQSTGCLLSNKSSNQSIKGVSNTNGKELTIKNTNPARIPSNPPAERYNPKRSSSIGPNSRNNDAKYQRDISVGTRSKVEPSMQGKKCLTKATFSIQISPTVVDRSTSDGPNESYDTHKSRYRANKNILPIDLTGDSIRQGDRNNEIHEKTEEKRNADTEVVQGKCETASSKLNQSFGGSDMKNILYFSEEKDFTEEAPIHKTSNTKTEDTSKIEAQHETVQHNPEYMRSRRSESFDGTNTKDLLYGGTVEQDIIPRRRSTKVQEKPPKKIEYELVQPDPEYMRSRRSDSFDGNNTKDILYGGPVQEDIVPRKNPINVTDAILRSGQYKYTPPCVRNSVGIGGDDAKNLIYGGASYESNENCTHNEKCHEYKTGSDIAIDEEEHQAKMRANRTACLGGDSMKNLMCNDLLKEARTKNNVRFVRRNESCMRKSKTDANEENHEAKMRANRTAYLDGDVMKDLMCDYHLKAPHGKKDNFAKVGENVLFLNGNNEEEDQLAKLRANRTACLGGDNMKNLMFDDISEEDLTKNNGKFLRRIETMKNESTIDSDEEDHQAKMRANRTACLGGDSMKNLMCGDHLKAPLRKKDNFAKVGENVILLTGNNDEEDQQAAMHANRKFCLGGASMKNLINDDFIEKSPTKNNVNFVTRNEASMKEGTIDSDEEDHQAQMRANRTACLGGDSMKNLMCDDHLRAPLRKKDNFAKVGENVMFLTGNNEEDQQAEMRANRKSCLGGASMKNIMCDNFLEGASNKNNYNFVRRNGSSMKHSVVDSDEEDNQAQMRANRTACLGGDSMKNLMCDDHLRVPLRKKDNFAKVGENVMFLTGNNYDEYQQDTLRANRNSCLGGASIKNIMCDNFLEEAPTNNNLNFVRRNGSSMKQSTIDSDEEDNQAQMRANRTACLGGDSMKNLMCDDHLRAPLRKKDNFAKVGENVMFLTGNNDEEVQQAALRANRKSCLGGASMKNIMCDNFLKEPPTKNNVDFVRRNGSSMKQSTFDSDEEENQAQMRANRTACLGGDSMKNIMCDDHLRAPLRKKDHFAKVGENIILLTGNNDEQDQLAELRVNREACLGGESIKNIMCDASLETPTRNKSSFDCIEENKLRMNISDNFTMETDEAWKTNRAASMGGSDMRNLLYGQNPSPPASRSRNRTPLKKSFRSSSVSEKPTMETDEASKTNRAASMGGSDMKNLLYGQNLTPKAPRSKNIAPLKKSIRSSSVSGNNMETDRDMKANRSASMGGSDMRNLLYDQDPCPPTTRSSNRASVRKSDRFSSRNATDDAERAFKKNRSASMGGSSMKNLLYGNAPSSRTSKRSSLKKNIRSSSVSGSFIESERDIESNCDASMGGSDMRNVLYGSTPSQPTPRTSNRISARSSSVSGNYTMDSDEVMKANRLASMGGSNMKNLIYGNAPSPPTSRSSNRSTLRKSSYFNENSTVNTSRDFTAKRSSSTEGSDMKSLLYGRVTSPTTSSNRAPLKKSLRSSSVNTRVIMNEPTRPIRSSSTEGSDMKSLIYGRPQSPPAVEQCYEPSSRSGEYSSNSTSNKSRCSQGVGPQTNAADIQEHNQEILRANRYKDIGGSRMKNLIYGETTNADQTAASSFSYEMWSTSPRSVQASTAQIEEENQEILTANRIEGIGGSDMKSLISGDQWTTYSRNENPFLESNEDNYEAFHFNRQTGIGGANMKSLLYGNHPSYEEATLSRRGYERKPETPRYETTPVIRHSAFEGDAMKSLIYGEVPSASQAKTNFTSGDNYSQIPHEGDAIQTQQGEFQSSTSVQNYTENGDGSVSFQYFSAESPDESGDLLIPYDVLDQFAPDCGDNIERTAVTLKHGSLVDCTCRMAKRNDQEKQPCVKHIEPKELQFYPEATKVIHIISSPLDTDNERKTAAIENNLARQYPNYYNNFVRKFNVNLSDDYRMKERKSKQGMVTSCRKLLAEEDILSKKLKTCVNRKINVSGKMQNIDKDFEISCNILRKDYPALFVQLLDKYDFPTLAFEKTVIEENRSNLIEISKLGPQKLKEFDDMFTNEQFEE